MPSLRRSPMRAVVLPTVMTAACLFAATGQCPAGEPAAQFLSLLRNAKYYDTAITYLERIDEFPGVDPEFKSSVDLEKAQTYVDAGVTSRSVKARVDYFTKAETALNEFLKQGSHPRISEARLQLGKLQMVRGAEYMNGEPDTSKRTSARDSYTAAAATFDSIVEDLRSKLQAMKGANIDPTKDPEKAALRNQYRGDFLLGKLNAAEARKMAARTFANPAQDGKELLQKSLEDFTDLSENYDTYVYGAKAMLYRGQVQEELGMADEALDSYTRMLEHPDAEPLRASKFEASSGLIRLRMAKTPPEYQPAIEKGQGILDTARTNEKRTTTIQELRVELAKAYFAKAKDKDNVKANEIKRAESSGRQLLLAASKIAGPHMSEAKSMLADMGIREDEVANLPKAEDPENLDDALAKARDLLSQSENISQALAQLKEQKNPDEAMQKQIADLDAQLDETRQIAIQILRRGLSMVRPEANIETLNHTRQFLSYMLYELDYYRDASVVGGFLARNAPGTEIGLSGGVVALSSLQMLLNEIPEGEDESVIAQLASLGDYMSATWPEDPRANKAKGVMIGIALRKDRWDDARKMVVDMPAGAQRARFERLIGQILWNKSVQADDAGNDAEFKESLAESEKFLRQGLEGIPTALVEGEGMKAALTLVRVYLRLGDTEKAYQTLDHPKYGPATLMEKQGPPDQDFPSDLYSAELQVVVQKMTTEQDPQAMLQRASDVMDKLRESVAGPDAQKRLTGIYLRMARDIRQQLDAASGDKKAKLIEAFRIFLERIASTTNDEATLQWVGRTLMELGEASMQPGEVKAVGQAAQLLTTAVETFKALQKKANALPLAAQFQLGRADRLLGNYAPAINTFEAVLKQKPMMLDAQVEAALAYEQWAGIVAPKFVAGAYSTALNGGRPNAQKKNTIWGWGRISQLTNGKEEYKDIFFDARYHVALCRFLQGKAMKSDKLKDQAILDITRVHTLYPDLGSPKSRDRFDRLLKQIQKDRGLKPEGLPTEKPKVGA